MALSARADILPKHCHSFPTIHANLPSTHGTIPDEALVTLTSKKYFANDDDKAERKRAKDEVESDDEDANLDKRALDSGEFDS